MWDTKVFPEIFDALYKYETIPGSEQITIDHLMNHTVGLWPTTTRTEDPMMNRKELNFRQLITAVMNESKIDAEKLGDKESNYLYSNFGYCLLGRVIEHVTGMNYLKYIQQTFNVDVLLAGATTDKLLPNESHYYSKDQEDCFNMPLARMDSCAGLIISP